MAQMKLKKNLLSHKKNDKYGHKCLILIFSEI